jgi:hypothetical protein
MQVINDGSCQWADLGPTNHVNYADHNGVSHDDTRWSITFNNYLGQDAPGACFIVRYDSVANEYSHFNTCTGNIYNTTCIGGTGYTCAGGSWSQTFIANPVPASQSLTVQHNGFPSDNLDWMDGSWNN